MKIIAIAFLIIAVMAMVYLAVSVALNWARGRRARRLRENAQWELVEHNDTTYGRLRLYAHKLGEAPIEILHPETGENGVSWKAQDFDMNLYVLRSEGEERVRTLNDKK